MQLFGIYTSEFEEGAESRYAAICLNKRDIVSISENNNNDNFGDLVKESVQLEHNDKYYDFECMDGDLTKKGKEALNRFLDEHLPSLC